MKRISQHSALKSMENYLDPESIQLDSRTAHDHLAFLSKYSTLINFYNLKNEKDSNWSQILLKDPIILLASISKTDVIQLRTLFIDTSNNLSNLVKDKSASNESLAFLFNSILNQLLAVYRTIEMWTRYMHKYSHKYALKHYLFKEIKDRYAAQLWAILSLKKTLHYEKDFSSIKPQNPIEVFNPSLYDDFEKLLWKDNQFPQPDWEALGLKTPFKSATLAELSSVLEKAGLGLIGLLNTSVIKAKEELENPKNAKSKFPDTTLIRSFANLLPIQTEELNRLNKKHLSFYYDNVLKQQKQKAKADRVFSTVKLTANTSTYQLKKGTEFKAGLDKNNQPVLFKTLKDTTLNNTSLTKVYTLCKMPLVQSTKSDLAYVLSSHGLSSSHAQYEGLYLKEIESPSTVKVDSHGKVLPWATFGGENYTELNRKSLGISFASPMLYLKEGKREITLTLTFSESINQSFLSEAKFSLSSAKEWNLIDPSYFTWSASEIVDPTSMRFTITLPDTFPPVEAFTKNPDGYSCDWPLLKIEFNKFKTATSSKKGSLSEPPIVTQLVIAVSVTGIKSFDLYNDSGKLNASKPFQLFGPTPQKNSNFFIGSNEILSKPIQLLNIELTWSNLPISKEFSTYYQEYNSYLSSKPENNTENVKISRVNALYKSIKKGAIKLFQFLKNLLIPIPLNNVFIEKIMTPFNNKCFMVEFSTLTNNEWSFNNSFTNSNSESGVSSKNMSGSAATKDELEVAAGTSLFEVDKINQDSKEASLLSDTSNFIYNNTTNLIQSPKPTIQLTQLNYTDQTSEGFIKMELSSPDLGFGKEVYPKVIVDIALNNAAKVIKPKSGKTIKPIANVPFTPTVKFLLGEYKASQTYNFIKTSHSELTINFPIECFSYTPFQTLKIYDNSSAQTVSENYTSLNLASVSASKKNLGVPLHLPYKFDAAMFLPIENLDANQELNLYFELARKAGKLNAIEPLKYSILGKKDWISLNTLSDSTQSLRCSGIVELKIPDNRTNQTVLMPPNQSWLSIGINNLSSTFAGTTFLATNGIELKRSGKNFKTDATLPPSLLANKITGPNSSISEISKLSQPFKSFGGRVAEDVGQKNIRVSKRIATKERITKKSNYYRLIQERFPEVFYSKTVYDRSKKSIIVYLVKLVSSIADVDAFMPLISECKELKVQKYLKKRSSAFASINMECFSTQFISISGELILKEGISVEGFNRMANKRLNLYFSPWVEGNNSSVKIDAEITNNEVVELIRTWDEVLSVSEVSFSLYSDQQGNNQIKTGLKKLKQKNNKDGIEPLCLFLPIEKYDLISSLDLISNK